MKHTSVVICKFLWQIISWDGHFWYFWGLILCNTKHLQFYWGEKEHRRTFQKVLYYPLLNFKCFWWSCWFRSRRNCFPHLDDLVVTFDGCWLIIFTQISSRIKIFNLEKIMAWPLFIFNVMFVFGYYE